MVTQPAADDPDNLSVSLVVDGRLTWGELSAVVDLARAAGVDPNRAVRVEQLDDGRPTIVVPLSLVAARVATGALASAPAADLTGPEAPSPAATRAGRQQASGGPASEAVPEGAPEPAAAASSRTASPNRGRTAAGSPPEAAPAAQSGPGSATVNGIAVRRPAAAPHEPVRTATPRTAHPPGTYVEDYVFG